MLFRLICLFSLGSAFQSALASPPNLSNLSSTQVSSVFKTFGSNFAFRPLEPASSYGKKWGLSFGLIGGLTSANAINSSIPGTNLSQVPSANIFFGLQGPNGLALELGILPQMAMNGFSFNSFGGNLKWTLSDNIRKPFPVDIAIRLMFSYTSMSYSETISGATDTVSLFTKVKGTNISVSKKLLIFEPYVGAGVIEETGTLSSKGAISLFNSSVTANNSYTSTMSSSWLYAGMQTKLLFLTISGQYDSMFGISTETLKVAFKF